MKLFEAFLGNQWVSWQASDLISIAKTRSVVTITTEAREAVGSPGDDGYRPAHDRLRTTFNLDVIPAYTLG